MKNVILLFITTLILWTTSLSIIYGQNERTSSTYDTYEAEWEVIDSLSKKGLPKSALEKIEDLGKRAKAENNAPQIIKTLIYYNRYQSEREEEYGIEKAILRMEKEIKEADFPVKPVLESLVAGMYGRYLMGNYMIIGPRSKILSFAADDISTWSLDRLNEKATELYKASLQDKRTQKINFQDFEIILTENKETAYLRPTLYDVLAHRAIDYFKDERIYLTEPASKFYIDQPEALGTVEEFVNTKFDTPDKQSSKYHTILYLQDLLRFHLKDEKKEALISADLKRLEFVMQNSLISDKSTLYINALERLIKENENQPVSAEIAKYLVKVYFQRGQKYQPGKGETYQYDLKKAYEIAKQVSTRFPDAYGAAYCRNMMKRITERDISLETEGILPSNQAFLIKLHYKNIDTAYFKIINKAGEQVDRTMRHPNNYIKYLNKRPTAKKWSVKLPNDKAYRKHSTEIKVESLPPGGYSIVIAGEPTCNPDKAKVIHINFKISDIAFFHKKRTDGTRIFYLMDRTSGKPLSGVKAEFYEKIKIKTGDRYYDYHYEYPFKGEVRSNSRGRLSKKMQDDYKVKFIYKEDTLNGGGEYSNYSYRREKTTYTQTIFFTDRTIYRPGQTIYFKGLVLDIDKDDMPKIKPHVPVTVVFKDANDQKVKTLKLHTNEYGTFNGSFIAPTTGLLGRMYIESLQGDDDVSFNVEEYKRPKFEANFDPVKGSFKPGDKVSVTGHAKAYAGSNVDGAKVVYRVTRYASFPYWRWRHWGSGSTQIVNGEIKTDETGKFTIDFDAIPDLSVPKERQPVFNYSITADVIDVTGETHSCYTNVKVGYIGIDADIEVPEKINQADLDKFTISTENLNGTFEPAKGTVKIEKLLTPKQTYLDRYWSKPTKHTIPEAEFKRDFPFFVYKNEDKIENWPIEEVMFVKKIDTGKSSALELREEMSYAAAGNYKVTFNVQDKFGQTVEVVKYFTLYKLNSPQIPDNSMFWHVNDKTTAEPGEQVNVYFGSAQKQLHVLYELQHDEDLISDEWILVNRVQRKIIDIKEKNRGDLYYTISFVKNNRAFVKEYKVNVPWTNKDLKIEYSTFRDKLLSGQDEEWQIKISGNKTDKVAAEMLVSMYDASLDAFRKHKWNTRKYPKNDEMSSWSYANNFGSHRNYWLSYFGKELKFETEKERFYPRMKWFGFEIPYRVNYYGYGTRIEWLPDGTYREIAIPGTSSTITRLSETGETVTETVDNNYHEKQAAAKKADQIDLGIGEETEWTAPDEETKVPEKETDFSNIKARTNLDETVFFFPNLQTDAEGNVIIKFKMNEALTRWKFMGFAHTKDYKYGFTEKEIITQKDLMVSPNPPRFFREGDEIHFTAKVSNLSEKDLSGTAQLQLFDALTMQPIDSKLGNTNASLSFNAAQGQSAPLSWKLDIPKNLPAVTWRVVAKAGTFSDGEESSLPVLSNRMLVTETMPLPVRGNETKTFTFKAMEKASQSNTLDHHKMTLEFTPNPAWYAVQALPYLMEYPYECTEQLFSRYYANSLASSVANSHPKVKRVFEAWKGTDVMENKLSKNQELKTALLEDTPWVLDAQSDEQQEKRIGLLFDLNKMADEKEAALRKMSERQLSNGGFSWFPGGDESWYITQYVVEGMGHLDKLTVKPLEDDYKTRQMIRSAVHYIDKRMTADYRHLKQLAKEDSLVNMEDDHLNRLTIHYLYARTFFMDISMNEKVKEVFEYYMGQADEYWTTKNMYMQGMLALALHRNEKTETPAAIAKSLRERSLNSEEMGMYWQYNTGYYWYQLPIETHAMMIEVFQDVANDDQAVNDLKTWMLKKKQTTHWKTTKATASAVYALLMSGQNWLLEDEPVQVKVGNKTIDQSKLKTEAGTGYFKTSWTDIDNSMSKVEVKNPNDVVAWGAMYWQYFEDLDKIHTFEDTPLTLKKQLFREENTATGPAIRPLSAGAKLQPGDKVKVRIELRVDRDMEYIHMKDMRASCFEPMNVFSRYKRQGRLGYYESTRDASTNFFMDYLPKGTYVFEYPLRVQHAGDFSNGITTIQCMYAPEFTSHSEGIRVSVEK